MKAFNFLKKTLDKSRKLSYVGVAEKNIKFI